MKPKVLRCPQCGSEKVAEILYGYPIFEAIKDDLETGRTVLGGCIVEEDAPQWSCQACSLEFGQVNQ